MGPPMRWISPKYLTNGTTTRQPYSPKLIMLTVLLSPTDSTTDRLALGWASLLAKNPQQNF